MEDSVLLRKGVAGIAGGSDEMPFSRQAGDWGT
jgi:hypothetical protein